MEFHQVLIGRDGTILKRLTRNDPTHPSDRDEAASPQNDARDYFFFTFSHRRACAQAQGIQADEAGASVGCRRLCRLHRRDERV